MTIVMQHHQILDDIEELEFDELEQLYGIEISDDETVWDLQEQREFESLRQWAYFTIAQEDDDNYAHATRIGSKFRFDDDRY